MNLSDKISEVSFAKRFQTKLKRLGIETVKDVLWHLPRRYEDFSDIKNIKDLGPNEEATVKGEIKKIDTRRSWKNRRLTITESIISDKTGSIKAIWFNQPYLANTFKKGGIIYLAGETSIYKNEFVFSNPIYEMGKEDRDTTHTARIIPIYPETKGLTSRGLRYIIEKTLKNLNNIPEILPEYVLKKSNIPDINEALQKVHFPEKNSDIQKARKRFSFEELFLLQISNLIKRIKLNSKKAPTIKINKKEIKKITSNLPFSLTKDQKKSLKEILEDIDKNHPMNRLLQGDVGSGKTIVAAIASTATSKNGYQTAFMAPTEILAKQHYEAFKKILPKTEGGIALLTRNDSKIFFEKDLKQDLEKKKVIEKISSGSVNIVIGTHALIQKNVTFKKLGLIIIDEQHRFGVEQRAKLTKKGEITPHLLSMTATPIPRTLAITAFGDLDMSIIKELPKNRKLIITKIVPPAKREKAYQFIRQEIKRGRQVFVICPRIEPGDKNKSDDKRKTVWNEVRAAKEEYENLSKKVFPNLKINLLHGKIKPQEKDKVMKDFSENKTNILVSTSVVEVGIDVPNATIMMIEGAERFGLAQLYQFKGRVGRGEHQSYCLLFSDSNSLHTKKRLNSLIKAKNGFELAEKDLLLRGPGQFLGKDQSGMPDNAMKALKNPELVKEARDAAIDSIKKDPDLKNNPNLKKHLKRFEKKIHRE